MSRFPHRSCAIATLTQLRQTPQIELGLDVVLDKLFDQLKMCALDFDGAGAPHAEIAYNVPEGEDVGYDRSRRLHRILTAELPDDLQNFRGDTFCLGLEHGRQDLVSLRVLCKQTGNRQFSAKISLVTQLFEPTCIFTRAPALSHDLDKQSNSQDELVCGLGQVDKSQHDGNSPDAPYRID